MKLDPIMYVLILEHLYAQYALVFSKLFFFYILQVLFLIATNFLFSREFNHKVKGISLSKWKFDEIRLICSLGNKVSLRPS